MSVVAQGIDLIECARVGEVLERHGERFLERILTPAERAYIATKREPLPHIAGRFAAKEAILKVLGTGWRGQISWNDVEVLNDSAGQPLVALSGECARVAARRGIGRVIVSITHTKNYAAAAAIGLASEGSGGGSL